MEKLSLRWTWTNDEGWKIQGYKEVRVRTNMIRRVIREEIHVYVCDNPVGPIVQPFSAVTQQIDFRGSLWALTSRWWVYNENADALLSCTGTVEQHYRIECVISPWTMHLIHCLKCDHSCWKWNSTEWSAWGNYSDYSLRDLAIFCGPQLRLTRTTPG